MLSSSCLCPPDARWVQVLRALVVMSLVATSAEAGAGELPVRIHYDAPAGCPDAAAFIDEVHRISPDVRGALGDEPAPLIEVNIEAEAEGRHRGRLVFEGGDGEAGVRDVDAASCAEASALLAFATALVVEGDGRLASGARSAPPPSAAASPARAPARRPTPSVRRDLSLVASTRIQHDDDGRGYALGASALFRRGLLALGVVGEVGGSTHHAYWGIGPAAGLVWNPAPWARVDVLGMGGVNTYFGVSPPERATRSAGALLPVVGGRVHANLEVSRVVVGLEGLVETNIGRVTRTYDVDDAPEGSPASRQGTFSIGTARLAAGVVLGTYFNL